MCRGGQEEVTVVGQASSDKSAIKLQSGEWWSVFSNAAVEDSRNTVGEERVSQTGD